MLRFVLATGKVTANDRLRLPGVLVTDSGQEEGLVALISSSKYFSLV